ncbi:ATP-dependent RNA helicase DDX54 [Tachysurus fulvidraco]|uniref:ATP-dependent RNA helicase DDX54 n=1 Tax=Tachysurus fulvidraco TaxID=1234273 RepID=UPI000F4E76BE|nr:ATP-dependent RNA helicase DDX54 [Tachysurus fulvidraco]
MTMAQRKKRMWKKKKLSGNREPDVDSDGGDFELAAEIKDDVVFGKKLPRFPTSADCLSDVEPDTREMVRAQNKKKKKSGGFQSMGLSYPVYKGVMKKGYNVPTPIQRKTIPVILDGKDVVAMARTGSGKTAAFLVPMFERLKGPQAQTGARAVVLTPTRELALQTMKFTKELGRFTGLKTALILGGDSMDDQFAALHENPDIIIGTPGRLMHVIMEMNLKLQNVEYVVFDEADRLFEMGFTDQLQEIIRRLPETRQTLLFSATLPKLLVEFARAGLTDPVLIRLDVDSKLSEQLKLSFFHLRLDDKPALLLYLLRNVVKPQEQTVVFVATKHHVEYLNQLLTSQGIECAYIYSALDQTARKINIGRFVHRKAMVLLVTDVAARGIDIPLLDNVINYNFPSKAKLFLHRVGRVARAGRSGRAFSLICLDEVPFVYDLHLFLGRSLHLATVDHSHDADGVLGRVPQSILDDEDSHVLAAHEKGLDLQNLKRISENAYKQYLKSRPNPSPESIKRVKNTDLSSIAVHPLLGSGLEEMELERLQMVDSIKAYKSKSTIFEINSNNKTSASEVMRTKRSRDSRLVDRFQKTREEMKAEAQQNRSVIQSSATTQQHQGEEEYGDEEEEDLQGVFSKVVGGKKRKQDFDRPKSKKKRHSGRDEEFYIPYRPKDFESERGLSLAAEGNSFDHQASSAVLDLMGDENTTLDQHTKMMRWDRKRKRFVHDTGKEDKKNKIKTESGQVVSAKKSKKSFYEEWKKKYKVDDADDSDGENGGGRGPKFGGHRGRHGAVSQPKNKDGSRVRSELKSSEQILKQRKQRSKQQFLQSGNLKKMRGRNKQRLNDVMKSGFGRGRFKKGKMRKRM